MIRWSPSVGAALLECIRSGADEPPAALTEVLGTGLVDELIDAATYHRVVGYVDRHLLESDCPPEAVADAWARREMAAHRHRAVLDELTEVATALRGSRISTITLKGPVLTERYYGQPGLRMYRDLDVLVKPGDFTTAVHSLEQRGYRLLDKNWRLARDLVIAQLHLAREGRPVVDLHWHVVFDEALRHWFRVPTSELFVRARPYTLSTAQVHALDDIDTLLHLCLHAGLEGAGRLVWVLDVDRVIARSDIDWDELVKRAVAARLHLVALSVLYRAVVALGTDVPRDVVTRLAPRAWSHLIGGALRAFPPQTARGTGDLSTLLTRSSRTTPWTTVCTAARRAVGRLGTFIATRSMVPRTQKPEDHVLFSSAGGDRGREEYFRTVTSFEDTQEQAGSTA